MRTFILIFLEYKPLNWWWLEGQKGKIKIKCHQGGIKQSQIRVLPADLRQTNGWWKADSVLMRTEAGALFRACTLTEACLQDTTLVAASNSPSWRQIKTSSSIYRNASHRIFLHVHIERIRRLQVGTTGLTTESCHLTDDSAIYCETVVHDTSSTEEKNLFWINVGITLLYLLIN